MKRIGRIACVLCVALLTGSTTAMSQTLASPSHADTDSPSLRWRAITPEPLRGGDAVSFLYQANDRSNHLVLGYSISDSDGDVIAGDDGISRTVGNGKIRWKAEYPDGSRLVPGLYRARLSVRDPAGNSTTSSWRPFRVLRPGRSSVIRRVDGAGPRVALTFDDCDHQGAWSRILRILAARDMHATFFCPGQQVQRFPKLARRTIEQGNAIGSHGWDHHRTTTLSYRAIRSRLVKDERVWWQLDRETPAPYFRPPYGSYDSKTLRAAGDTGYARTIFWDVDSFDWKRPGPSVIAHRVVSKARSGSIVELNVLGQTADALVPILRGLRRHHLRPVTLPELFEAGGLH